jgi:hypothetical protein
MTDRLVFTWRRAVGCAVAPRDGRVKVHDSARKHGVAPDDAVQQSRRPSPGISIPDNGTFALRENVEVTHVDH